MDVLVVDEGVDEVGTFVGLESLRVVNEAAAASTVGFGWFFPGIGLSTVIAEVEEITSELSGVARGVLIGAVTNRGASTETKIVSVRLTYILYALDLP
jgi:hypothetical protein